MLDESGSERKVVKGRGPLLKRRQEGTLFIPLESGGVPVNRNGNGAPAAGFLTAAHPAARSWPAFATALGVNCLCRCSTDLTAGGGSHTDVVDRGKRDESMAAACGQKPH